MSMSKAELEKFLGQGRMGVVATIRKDGSPQATPVWYRYDGRTVTIWTEKGRVWVKNIEGDNRVAFSVQDEKPPYAAVLLRGRAKIAHMPNEEGFAEAKVISTRYIREDELEAYVKEFWPKTHTFVTITPEATTSWGRGY